MFVNQIVAEGRVGKAPETKQNQQGQSVTKTSLALYAGKDKPCIWLKLTAWAKMSEVLAEVSKGDSIVVCGELVQDTWQGSDGQTKSELGINVRGFSWGSKPRVNNPAIATSAPPVEQDPWGGETVPF